MLEESMCQSIDTGVWADVDRVCRRIPPLWDLANFVAVNPFLGFSAMPIDQAARMVRDGLGANALPCVDFYRERWKQGQFGTDDLVSAAARWGQDPERLEAVLEDRSDPPCRLDSTVLTFAERHDRRYGGRWEEAVIRQIARWCAVYVGGGGTYWSLPVKGQSLYASWVEAARVDRTLEVAGLRGWRKWAAELPEQTDQAISAMLARLEVLPEHREAYLYRLLGGVYGWASFLRRDSWIQVSEDPGAVADLLAIRICADCAIAALAPRSERETTTLRVPRVEDEATRLVLQDALEDRFARRLLSGLNPPGPRQPPPRPALQAVFCIDVRSEPFRRHLEAQSAAIETRGFAGFFGVALDLRDGSPRGSARCPVLLKPAVAIRSQDEKSAGEIVAAAKHLQMAPASAFSFVEIVGLAYGLGLSADASALPRPGQSSEGSVSFDLRDDGQGAGIPVPFRVELAAGILKNMGLRHVFARIVLLCGHESHSANNPHAAGLDCGACGGHSGAINARVAAALLNDPEVRERLQERGWKIPGDTIFLAGIHDTTVDEVTLLDMAQVPVTFEAEIEEIQGWLARAGELTRAERAASLGLAEQATERLEGVLRRRSRDWSEVRPEWGLARNAAFLAAPRQRSRGVDLQGRVFLHEYDASLDPDGTILTLILTAPVVVASWINLQYFASTVDNSKLGSGTKTLHNRVGSLGVVLGNGGDLRTGLPIQSVQAPDGRWYHEPLRLQVMVEASKDKIDAVLAAHPGVCDLVENGWIRLFALDSEGAGCHLRVPGGEWEGFQTAELSLVGGSN